MQLLGVDTGGTFTDFVLLRLCRQGQQQIRIHKVLSTPAAPEQAILQGVAELDLMAAAKAGELMIIHGSTVATNAALEGKGVRTLFISNRGFKDLLTIGRQTRRELYQLQPEPVAPPVPAELCLESGGRLDAEGNELEPVTAADLQALKQAIATLQPQAVAINLLFSFLDDRYEKQLADCVPEHIFCSRSSFVLPEYKEYERGIATWLNAWLGPLVQHYLQRLQQALSPAPLTVMQSSGGTISADQAARRAVNLLLSGPAGGLAAALFIGKQVNSERLLTFDMGGTSTDVALIDGEIQLTNEGRIAQYPVAVPMVDMHTIGAGGGSIAYLDDGGLLCVGPQSAGADPGPACYGRSGQQATVTDANLVLGRLRADAFLGGQMRLDVAAARQVISRLAQPLSLSIEETAEGIIAIANEHMARALRVTSVQRGYDPGEFQLCCFGGAGGLHICALAEALNMQRAMVPIHGGVLSALGMLVAPRQRQLVKTCQQILTADSEPAIEAVLADLQAQGQQQLIAGGIAADSIHAQASVDLRYLGQSYTLTIPWQHSAQAVADFHRKHQQRYGHRLELAVELVNARQSVQAFQQQVELPGWQATMQQAPQEALLYGFEQPVPIRARQSLRPGEVIQGPLLVTEQVSTTLVAEGWQLCCDSLGNLQLQRRA
jgi:N-methylhydantoinase A